MTTETPNADLESPDEFPLRAPAAAVALFVTGMVLNVGLGVTAFLVFGRESIVQAGTGFWVSAVGGMGLVLAVAAGYIYWRGLSIPVTVPDREESLLIGGAVVVSVLAAVGLTYLRERVVPTETTSGLAEIIGSDPMVALGVAALSLLLIAPAEELLFRGAIQGRIRQRFGPVAAVLGASALFGAWHLLNFGGSLLGTVLAAGIIGAVSLLWGWAYARTDNFAVPVLVHGLYNAVVLGMGVLL